MNTPPDPPPSKGMAMIASYRAARLSQRPVLRTSLRQSHIALRQGREARPAPVEPPHEVLLPDALDAPVQAAVEAASVFAGLVSLAVAVRADEDEAAPETVETIVADEAPPPPPEAPAEPAATQDPKLAEIGFGPGMLIRLSQLGLRTVADLAQADPSQLRVALGDISRLVDVETWINNARQTAARL